MLRNRSMMRLAAMAAVIVLVGATISEAQGRRGRGNRGGRFGGGRFGRGGSIAILKNEYLQKELNFTSAQKQRVEQIDIQMAGIGALQREDVQKKLNITSAQKEKMTSIQSSQREKMRELFGGFRRGGRRGNRGDNDGQRPDFNEIRKKMTELRESTNKEIMAVLTSTQKTQFEQMKGKPVDLEKLRPQRRRGGRRRGAPERPDI